MSSHGWLFYLNRSIKNVLIYFYLDNSFEKYITLYLTNKIFYVWLDPFKTNGNIALLHCISNTTRIIKLIILLNEKKIKISQHIKYTKSIPTY